MTQDPIEVTFSSDFVTGNVIVPVIDGLNLAPVNYATSHLATITNLAQELANRPEIDTATVGGTGNRSITVTMVEFQQIDLSFNITGGASQPTFNISGGRPPKSFEAVVQGGSDLAVAEKIWETKPAGIATFGNIAQPITDSQGNTQVINFSRATPVYIWVQVNLVLNPQEVFPVNGQQLVSQAILSYGNSLGIGVDVFLQRVLAQVFTVPGIASATVLLARTSTPTDTPSYLASDIIIGETEISTWDLGRIFVSI